MVDIVMKDALRAAVEMGSGGEQTVIYTPKGQPSYMNVIPTKKISQLFPVDQPLNTAIHPAFLIGGKTLSRLFMGTYPGILKNGEIVSQPGAVRGNSYSAVDVFNAMKTQGAGWHIMTFSERALLQGLCSETLFNPAGISNSGYCKMTDGSYIKGIRIDGMYLSDQVNDDIIEKLPWSYPLTGSGPAAVRHNGKFSGISDLHNNYSYTDPTSGAGLTYLTPGIRVFGDELQIYQNNDLAAITDISVLSPLDRSSGWKAIDGTTGQFVQPTFTGTAGTDLKATTPNTVRVLNSGAYANWVWGQNTSLPANSFSYVGNWGSAEAMIYNMSDAALSVLKLYGFTTPKNLNVMCDNSNFNSSVSMWLSGFPSTNVSTSTYFNLFASIWGLGLTSGSDFTISSGMFRPCFYNASDLS